MNLRHDIDADVFRQAKERGMSFAPSPVHTGADGASSIQNHSNVHALNYPRLYDNAIFTDGVAQASIAYTPIELTLYATFAECTIDNLAMIEVDDSVDGVLFDEIDPDYVAPPHLRRTLWDRDFADHHWLVVTMKRQV